MSSIVDLAKSVWRAFETDGVPATGQHKPIKGEIVGIFSAIYAALQAIGISGAISVAKATQSALFADLGYAAGALALVHSDADPAKNGIYQKSGGSGAGAWTLKLDLGPSAINAINALGDSLGKIDKTVRGFNRGVPQWAYGGAGPVFPIITDRALGLLLYYNADTGRLEGPALDSAAGAAAAATPPVPLAPAYKVQPADVYGVITYAQSLSNGYNGVPPLSVAQPYLNETFGYVGGKGGVRSALNGSDARPTNQTPMTTKQPLIEDALPVAEGCGETPLSGACNGATELAIVENGLTPNDLKFFASAAAPSGASFQIKPSSYYTNLLNHVTKAKAIKAAEGKSYVVAAILAPWGAAEPGMSDAAHKTQIQTFILDLQGDVAAITGQTSPVHFIFTSAFYDPAYTTGGHAQVILDICNERPDCWYAGSHYTIDLGTDPPHFSNVGQRKLGRIFARALKSLIIDQVEPQFLKPISATVQGSTVRVRFDPAYGPIRLDPAGLGSAPQDGGFKVTSASGTSTIVSKSIAKDGRTLVLELAASPGLNPVVSGAMAYDGASNTTRASTLRDSRPDDFKAGATRTAIPNWCPPFSMPIIVLGS